MTINSSTISICVFICNTEKASEIGWYMCIYTHLQTKSPDRNMWNTCNDYLLAQVKNERCNKICIKQEHILE